MPLPGTNWDPSRRQLRHFSWLTTMLLAVFAWRGLPPLAGLLVRVLAALIFAVGTVWPGAFRWPYRALLVITYPMGRVVGDVLLAVVYFGLITPLALCFRVLGRDPLGRRLQAGTDSYWQPRLRSGDYRSYFHQF